MVSENVTVSVESTDRRTRKREARRDALLDHAADLVDRLGPDGFTMTALAEASDYAPASLYTYFPSRSALFAALQQQALGVLGVVATEAVQVWDASLASRRKVDPVVAALARLTAFGDLFLTAPEHHGREFRLQQRLLVTPDIEERDDVAAVVPAAMAVLAVPRQLLASAVDVGALEPPEPAKDPIGLAADQHLHRTLSWIVAMNGALLLDDISIGLTTTGLHLGRDLTQSLLRGWGAAPKKLIAGRSLADTFSRGHR
jgi:AcrR family transcriptional regulator